MGEGDFLILGEGVPTPANTGVDSLSAAFVRVRKRGSPSRHEDPSQHLLIVGPASATLAQQRAAVGCRDLGCAV